MHSNDLTIIIIAAASASGCIGFLTATFFLGLKKHRIERDTWRHAMIYYTRRTRETLAEHNLTLNPDGSATYTPPRLRNN